MSHSVRRHLHLDIADYDATIRRFIPGYEVMLTVAADAVAEVRPDSALDLGAGTGSLSAALLAHEAVGRVELLDVDPEMLDLARRRLSAFGERVRFSLRSYDGPLPPSDAIAASLALHHLPTLEAKAELFEHAFTALRPGGVFVNADANMPPERSARDRLYRAWADHLVASGIAEERAWQHFEEWSAEDRYLPLEDELRALRAVGFEAEAVWSDGPINVVVARRP